MGSISAEFIDCSSLSISYDVMGLATVSYTVVHSTEKLTAYDSITVGGQTFTGYVMNARFAPMQDTAGWYETNCTLIAVTS